MQRIQCTLFFDNTAHHNNVMKDGSRNWGWFAHFPTQFLGLKGLTEGKYRVSLQMKNATKNVVQYCQALGLSRYGQITWDFQTGPLGTTTDLDSLEYLLLCTSCIRTTWLTLESKYRRIFTIVLQIYCISKSTNVNVISYLYIKN